jgi:hypothetical protein
MAEKVKRFVGNTQKKARRKIRRVKKIERSKKSSSKRLIFYA